MYGLRIWGAVLVTAMVGCSSGDYRRVALDENLTPGDLAHYRMEAGSSGGKIEDYSGAFPLRLAPVFHRSHETHANRVDGEYHYHSEDVFSTLLLVSNRIEVADHDNTGELLAHETRHKVLLGLFEFVSGVRKNSENKLQSTGGFSMLWSGFGYDRRTNGRVF
ncbi:MAG: hypothetical protein AAF488_19730, partial [Planctomycetota bacterium]